MIWSAERWVLNRVGRIHWACVSFKSSGWGEAEAVCTTNGWRNPGPLLRVVEASELDDHCAGTVDARDLEWVEGGVNRIVDL